MISKKIIYHSLLTWGGALISFTFYQSLRIKFIETFIPEKPTIGFISLKENPEGILQDAILYRIMHNFTHPCILIFYVLFFLGLFLIIKKKNFTKKQENILEFICIFIHATIMIIYIISVYLPRQVFPAIGY